MIVFEKEIFFDRTSSFLYSRRRGNFIGELQSDGIATYKSNMEKMKRKSRRKNLYDIIQIFLFTSVILTCTVPLSLWKSTYWLETSSSLLSFIVRFVATSPLCRFLMKGLYCAAFLWKDYTVPLFTKRLYCASFSRKCYICCFWSNGYTAAFFAKGLYCAFYHERAVLCHFSRKGYVVSPFLESAILCYFSSKGFSVPLFHNKSMLYFSRKGYTVPLFHEKAILCRFFTTGLYCAAFSLKGYTVPLFTKRL